MTKKLSKKQQELMDVLDRGGFVILDRVGVSQKSVARLFDENGEQVAFPLLIFTACALYRRDLVKDVAGDSKWFTQKKWVKRDHEQELQDTLDAIKSKR